MKNNLIQELSAGILIILLVLILNPFHIWMPDMMHIMVLIALLIVFAVFTSFILQERITDERDGVHRMLAGRAAFLAGSTILIIGIIAEAYSHTVDRWLILTLVVMILAKIITRVYSDKNL